MTKTSRDFHIGDVLSITTGRLVSPRGMEGVYDILKFMTGNHDLMTHQLSRVHREMGPRLVAQHPDLEEVTAYGVGRDNWQRWIAEMVERYGETRRVTTEYEFHESKDPIAEALEMNPNIEIIPVVIDEER